MKNHVEPPKLPYVAKTHWVLRWGLLLTYIPILAVFVINYADTMDLLSKGGAVVYIGLILIFVVGPYSVATMFISKTVFYETHIEHINQLFMKKSWKYEEVEKSEISNNGHIRITFNDGDSIKIWRAQTRLDYVIAILESRSASGNK